MLWTAAFVKIAYGKMYLRGANRQQRPAEPSARRHRNVIGRPVPVHPVVTGHGTPQARSTAFRSVLARRSTTRESLTANVFRWTEDQRMGAARHAGTLLL